MVNKMTKGAVAVAAGVTLLLGGAGTYAWWSVEQSAAEQGEIQSGDLDLALGQAAWTLNGDPVTADVTQVRVVPGDVLVLTQSVTVTAIGDDLASQLSVSETDLTGTDPQLVEALDVEFTLPEETGWATLGEQNTYAIASSSEAYAPVEATVVITFDEATEGQVGTNAAVDLTSVVFSLDQLPTI
ncbi:alternate-type signal peptide domain-containing protein [Georgenia sp. 10Sc9-8]|uniref:Alternate-type signal peptide domain-containing protein n=1 Tax=Georgenia halotolerans TaxID=3028317 RepID=A0ABT5TX98_9MICO|nr:alternate-type signal peptide domain-containing protein [Georgenia halotolerans]